MAAVLHPSNPPAVLTEALLIYSHLARISRDFYPALGSAGVASQLRPLLLHREPGVRAKACNMIGNMCKHSEFFYGALRDGGLLDALIRLCSDGDRTTRKFACFAIGNAGFHRRARPASNRTGRDPLARPSRVPTCSPGSLAPARSADLYDVLRPSIPPLVALLDDEEPKTRANAAGALGNFVRNSDGLCRDLIAGGAPEALLRMVANRDGGGTPRSTASSATATAAAAAAAGSDSGSPLKMALFSLGNMCAYPICRTRLLELGLIQMLAPLASLEDPTVKKFVQRIQGKLQG